MQGNCYIRNERMTKPNGMVRIQKLALEGGLDHVQREGGEDVFGNLVLSLCCIQPPYQPQYTMEGRQEGIEIHWLLSTSPSSRGLPLTEPFWIQLFL